MPRCPRCGAELPRHYPPCIATLAEVIRMPKPRWVSWTDQGRTFAMDMAAWELPGDSCPISPALRLAPALVPADAAARDAFRRGR